MEKSTKSTIVLLAILIALLLFLPRGGEQQAVQPPAPAQVPTLSLSPVPLRENQSAEISLHLPPSCPYADGQLSIDGQAVSGVMIDESNVIVSMRLALGRHIISYENGACRATLRTEVLPALCKDGAIRACSNARGCAGTQECRAGAWLACRVPVPVCAPNIKVPCPLDSCRWGIATCNSCGSGWSKCQ